MQEFSVDSGDEKTAKNSSKKKEEEVPIQQILNHQQFGVEPTGKRMKKSEMKSGLRPRGHTSVSVALILSLLVIILIIVIAVGYFYMKGNGYL